MPPYASENTERHTFGHRFSYRGRIEYGNHIGPSLDLTRIGGKALPVAIPFVHHGRHSNVARARHGDQRTVRTSISSGPANDRRWGIAGDHGLHVARDDVRQPGVRGLERLRLRRQRQRNHSPAASPQRSHERDQVRNTAWVCRAEQHRPVL